MLIPYESLQQLPTDTLNNLIKEYLFAHIEDGGFSELNEHALTQAISRCHLALQRQELVVEYSEAEESIAIRSAENCVSTDRSQV
ncbi:YheU family protein [Shewanella sp. NIFS-20-20]|uniref:YheU family protein n=1 Tax=Shewanella sp. NIFS-20-20 TaxID=2853806 RepID=UPI001C4501C3|nr:YheU family protein [Shewanella sp. NIFS-20-20]MBV7316286.1 YheU family protein [Shewanella sp. NIFS-20-20]